MFIHIFETKSISKTALMLNHTPSSISKKLTKLEMDLKVQLVERSTNYLEITPVGHDFYEKCKEIMIKVRECEHLLIESNNRVSGKLGLSIPEIMSNNTFYDCIADFTKQYPDVKFNIQVANKIVDSGNTNIDFFIRSGSLQDSQLIAIKLLDTSPILCASLGYLEQKGVPINLLDAVTCGDFIAPSYVNLNQKFKQFFSAHNIQYHELATSHLSDNLDGILKLVKRGVGFSLVPHIYISKELTQGELVPICPQAKFPTIPVNLIYRKRATPTKLMTLFKEHICDYFKHEKSN